uniref:Uncharacterized protein n=1 Tax=Arundo donax TaxID=35708 RepID=A0A0A8ZLS1_ARUDO
MTQFQYHLLIPHCRCHIYLLVSSLSPQTTHDLFYPQHRTRDQLG